MDDRSALQRAQEQGRTPLVHAATDEDEQHEEPKSAFVLMLFFLMLLAGIWFYVYQILIARQ
jgi:hypothetical protein